MLNNSGDSGHSCIFPGFDGNAAIVSRLNSVDFEFIDVEEGSVPI